MSHVQDIHGTAFKNASAILLARVVDADGNNIQQTNLSAIEYSIYELDPAQLNQLTIVLGHNGVSLGIEDVIFDTLQTGGLWTTDEIGYNFRHQIDVSENEAFPTAGTQYQVRYQLTPTTGQKSILRFQLRVI